MDHADRGEDGQSFAVLLFRVLVQARERKVARVSSSEVSSEVEKSGHLDRSAFPKNTRAVAVEKYPMDCVPLMMGCR